MGRLKYVTLEGLGSLMPSQTFEVEMIASHEENSWVRLHRRRNAQTGEYEPLHFRSYHTVRTADLREEPHPAQETDLTAH